MSDYLRARGNHHQVRVDALKAGRPVTLALFEMPDDLRSTVPRAFNYTLEPDGRLIPLATSLAN
jgi:hypothetical protein